LFAQQDRRKLMKIDLPRTWKAVPGENIDPKALLSMHGFLGEPEKSPQGQVNFYLASQFARATLARAIDLPQVGPVKAAAARQGAGWAEGCAMDARQKVAQWRRYVEKGGRVYMFVAYSHSNDVDTVMPQMQKILDTAVVTGDYAPPALQQGWNLKKLDEFDVVTDALAEREKSVAKQKDLLAAGREAMVKALPGKPFDASRPTAWVFQNATKYEEKVKEAIGIAPKYGTFEGVDRASMVELMSETADEHNGAIYRAGANQYVWQYFGGDTPHWLALGLGTYGEFAASTGGKIRLSAAQITKVKAAAAAGKRKLNEWIDVASASEITDVDQAALELFAWHTYFRTGRGSKKFKKQYDAYIQQLRETGDPTVARKAFDGANFDEMLADFKDWAADWK
jgi:hypothetical protein